MAFLTSPSGIGQETLGMTKNKRERKRKAAELFAVLNMWIRNKKQGNPSNPIEILDEHSDYFVDINLQ